MKRRSKKKTEQKGGSRLLSTEENERVEDLLGRRCVSLCTTVVQLFLALPHSPNSWSLQHTGVLCFVKDNPQRSYFIRLYSVTAGKLIWEQELFNQFSYNRSKPFFHTFQTDDCQVGLNFANEEEAENFFSIVDEKISQREKRQGKGHAVSQDDLTLPLPPNGLQSQNPPPTQAPPTKSKKEKKNKENKGKKGSKLSKALIGAPSGFTHVGHLSMDSNSSMDPDLLNLLSRAGISDADMRDSETSQLIYDVIERSGGIEAVKKELTRHERPPPPPPVVRRPSHSPVPPGSLSSPISSQARLGPLPPTPGPRPSFIGTRTSSVRSLPPTPSGGCTGPLPTPSVTQRGWRGFASEPPGPQVPPLARSAPLPPVPGGHGGALPPPPGDESEHLLCATFPRSGPSPPLPGRESGPLPPLPGRGLGPLPPLPGRGSGPLPPGQQSGPNRPAPRDPRVPMPPGHFAGSFPPPPGRCTGSLPQPPNDDCYLLPPPTLAEDFPSPPSSDIPSLNDTFPPPPAHEVPSCGILPNPLSTNASVQGPPAPPLPPPPPAAPAFSLKSGPPPFKASSGGGTRGALLDQIRIGTKLKMVTASPDLPSSAAPDTADGIVGALMMVMQKRSKVIHSSDDGDEFDDDDDDDEEWD